MNTKQAITNLKEIITNLDAGKFEDVTTILELGAGNVFLKEDFDNKRSQVIMELVDSVVYSTCDADDEYQPEAEFKPVYAGGWEIVLASLVIAQRWERISECAQSLRMESRRRDE